MNKLKLFEGVMVFALAVTLVSLFLLSNPEITGNAIRITPDYQEYKAQFDDKAYEAIEESAPTEKQDYIVTLAEYEENIEEIYDVIDGDDVQVLPLVGAVAISAQKEQVVSILGQEVVEKIYLDEQVEALRSSALEILNVTNIRTLGPSHYNLTGSGVKVAILDTGVDYNHSEFNCTPGETGCFMKYGTNLISGTQAVVTRTQVESLFDDYSSSKVLTEGGVEYVTFKLKPNHTIHSATVRVNESISVTLNDIAISAGETLDLASAITASSCADTDEYCYYNLTFSLTGDIKLTNLAINYTFSHIETTGDVMDDNNHGTSVTGIVHQTAPDAEVYEYKVLDNQGVGSVSNIIAAIELAILDQVDIISLSLGVPRENGPCSNTPFEAIIDEAYARGITVVAASGNDNADDVYLPACFTNAIAVSSIADDKTPSSFNSIGPEVDFAMPGESISVPVIGGGTQTGQGTSLATPFASGVFAMAQEYGYNLLDRRLSPSELKNMSIDSATDISSSGFDNETGNGMIEVSGLLQEVEIFNLENDADINLYVWDYYNFFLGIGLGNITIFTNGVTSSELVEAYNTDRSNLNEIVNLLLSVPSSVNVSNFTLVVSSTSLDMNFSSVSEGFDKIFTTSEQIYYFNGSENDVFQNYTFTFDEVEEVNFAVYAHIGDNEILVSNESITLYDNLSIQLRDGFIFQSENTTISFDVVDNLNKRINVDQWSESLSDEIGYIIFAPVTDEGSLYYNPNITVSLNGTALNTSVTKENVTVYLTSYPEGSYYLNITYEAGGNSGSSYDLVSVVNPLNVSIGAIGSTVNSTSNITIVINLSKLGDNVTGNITLSDTCSEITMANESVIGFNTSESLQKEITLYTTQSAFSNQDCILFTNINVYGSCYHCSNQSELAYTEIYNTTYSLQGSPVNVTTTIAVNDTSIKIGEYVDVIVSIANNDTQTVQGSINATFSGIETISTFPESFSINSGVNQSFVYTFYSGTAGTKEVNFTINISGAISTQSQDITVSGDLFTVTAAREGSSIYEDGEFDIIVGVTNNDNKSYSVSSTIGDYQSQFSLQSATSSPQTIIANGVLYYNYTLKANSAGTSTITGNVSGEGSLKSWSLPVTVRTGKFVNVTLTDSFKKYTVGVNDTLGFTVNAQCEDILDSCTDVCEDDEDSCKDYCESDFDIAKAERDSCRLECEGIEDTDDRRDCKDDCDAPYDDAKEDKTDCRDECTDDLEDCTDDCTDDYDDCIDDTVSVEVIVEEFDENEIDLEFVSDEVSLSFNIEESDTYKLDLDDDGYYETEFELFKLVEPDENSCEDICEATKDSQEDICSADYDICYDDCDDSSCRSDCRDDRDDCKDDAGDEYDDCVDDCEIEYIEYEIKLQTIDLEEVLSLTEIPVTTPVQTEPNGTNETSEATGDISGEETEQTPEESGGEEPGSEPEDIECTEVTLEYCLDEVSCERFAGYWYDNYCNAFPQEVPEEDIGEDPQEEEPTIIDEPTVEIPGGETSSSPFKYIIIGLVLAIIIGLGAGGYSMMHKGPPQVENMQTKKERVIDYMIKQLEKGHPLHQISKALKGLGWDPVLVDTAVGELAADPNKRALVQIVRFAKENHISQPQLLQKHFPGVRPDILQEAMNHIQNKK